MPFEDNLEKKSGALNPTGIPRLRQTMANWIDEVG